MLVVATLIACRTSEPSGPGPGDPEPPAPTGETAVPPPPPAPFTGHTGDSAPPVGTADTAAPPYDCAVLPAVPVASRVVPGGFETAEDFDFDDAGFLCTIRNARDLACKDQSGNAEIRAPRLVLGSAGTRFLPNGDWVVAGSDGTLVRWDHATGGSVTVLAGMAYPNGVEVGRDGYVYVGENSSDRVRQVDPYTGEDWTIGRGLVSPNGVILSPDEQILYVGSFGGGYIYAIDRLGEHDWAEARVLAESPGFDGGFDGINVDVCGNVYWTEFMRGKVWRATPDGLQVDLVADLPDAWIPNMRWGSNVGGWDPSVLYVSAWTRVHALDMGIPGKPHISQPPAP